MSVQFQDYYKILGVSRSASQQDIQKAYRKLARKYHPDVNKEKGAEEQFKKVTEAYEVLKNPETRQKYDALGQNWKAGDPFSPPQGWQNINFDFGNKAGANSGFSNFFDMIFGQTFKGNKANSAYSFWEDIQSGPHKGEDLESEIEITLNEAFTGVQKELSFQNHRHQAAKRIQIKIPPGATEGTRLRFKGQGGKGSHNGPAGDLILKVKLAPHPQFTVSGHDLKTTIPISPWEAALGAKLEVKTLSGNVNLKIPAGSQSGKILRLKGKGLPLKKDGFGDLYVELKIVVPQTLTPKEKELFEVLAEESKFQPR